MKKLRKEQKIILIGIAVVLMLSLTQEKPAFEVGVIPGEWEIPSEGFEQYLIEEEDFDYSNPLVYSTAQEIKSNSRTPERAVRETLRFVVANVRYSSAITISYCFDEKASTVLRKGFGDCVSMSRLVVSLLRAQGIPARSVGGCLSAYKRCAPVFAVIPLLEARTTEMVEDDFKKRGFLHEWVEIYTPEKGWRIAEATSGQLFSTSCYSTGYLIYAYDTNPIDRCVVLDSNFWNQCKIY